MKEDTDIDLENIVYYKDDTHYFVMTAKKDSLLRKGVLMAVSIVALIGCSCVEFVLLALVCDLIGLSGVCHIYNTIITHTHTHTHKAIYSPMMCQVLYLAV